MNNYENVTSLKTLTCDRLKDTLQQIGSHREKHSLTDQMRFYVPEYLLDEAMEYLTGAWDMILTDRPKAAVTLARWIVEASLNLYWVVRGNAGETNARLKDLLGEAKRHEANMYEAFAELWKEDASLFLKMASDARKVRGQGLGVVDRLPNLEIRLKHVQAPDDLYSVYRLCCGAAHPALNVWEKFGPNGSTGRGSPIDIYTACWMASHSTLHLVITSYMLTKLETIDEKVIRSWWKEDVTPLLDSIKTD